MLGPILPASGGSHASRTLALASRRHPTGTSFQAELTRKAAANVLFSLSPDWSAGLGFGVFPLNHSLDVER